MLKCYKTEIDPTPEQAQKLKQNMGTCRFLSNLYQNEIEMAYVQKRPFPSASDFYKWINEVYIPSDPDKTWILDTHSKARKQVLTNKYNAYQRFFKGKAKHPTFKKKGRNECSYYFVKTDKKAVILSQRHRIKIPGYGWIRLKEKGYIPVSDDQHVVRSGHITQHAGRFYVSVLMDVPEDPFKPVLESYGIGIDMGIKELAVCSDGKVFKNINKTRRIKKLKAQLRHAQRILSRRYEALKKRTGCKDLKDALKAKGFSHANIEKARQRVAHIHARLALIRHDYLRQTASKIAKAKPSYVTVERLNVKGMMKNRHLARAVAEQCFYTFKMYIVQACSKYGIEVREVDTWYPSSKTCHACGSVKKDLKLNDRTYICPECGHVEDRDMNAALNLRDVKVYSVI